MDILPLFIWDLDVCDIRGVSFSLFFETVLTTVFWIDLTVVTLVHTAGVAWGSKLTIVMIIEWLRCTEVVSIVFHLRDRWTILFTSKLEALHTKISNRRWEKIEYHLKALTVWRAILLLALLLRSDLWLMLGSQASRKRVSWGQTGTRDHSYLSWTHSADCNRWVGTRRQVQRLQQRTHATFHSTALSRARGVIATLYSTSAY